MEVGVNFMKEGRTGEEIPGPVSGRVELMEPRGCSSGGAERAQREHRDVDPCEGR